MEELMDLLSGKFYEVAMQHDASRVVQSAIQFGTIEQRRLIVKEICEHDEKKDTGNKKKITNSLLELAKLQYAHFVLLKMIKYCYKDSESVSIIVKSLKGNMSKLAVHAVGSRVVELLFSTFPPKATAKLKLEFYGNKFSLFADSSFLVKDKNNKNTSSHPTLKSILQESAESHPSDKATALKHLLSILTKGIEKSLFSFGYFQQLIYEYVTVASPNEIRANLNPLLVDQSIHLLSTRAGARVVAELIAYGTPKDRKRVMKSLKGYTRSSLLHPDGYIAIIRIIDTVDDTVNVQKSVLAELHQSGDKKSADEMDTSSSSTSPILDLALSNNGSKLFLYLLAKEDDSRRKYFDPSELEFLHSDPKILDEKTGEEVPTSKKNPSTRRLELLQYMKKLLVELCCSHAESLLKSRYGMKILREVCTNFPSKELAKAIVDACCSSIEDGESLSVFEDPVGHLAIKNLIKLEDGKEGENNSGALSLSTELYTKFQQKLLKTIGFSNRGAFILVSMTNALAAKDTKNELKGDLKALQQFIKKKKKNSEPTAGFDALMKAIS